MSELDGSQDGLNGDMTFRDLGVCEELIGICEKMDWKRPTKIQCEAIPWALKGRDVIGLAQTGSGKTGAFSIPMIQSIRGSLQPFFGLVLTPTRELALQISEQIEKLGSILDLYVVTIVGGVDMMAQAICLSKKPNIVVGTPGRILDHLRNTKGFSLHKLKYLVMDEADRLLNMEFEKSIESLIEMIPKNRVTFLFSATMTSKVSKLQRASLKDPVKIEVHSGNKTVSTLIQNFLFIPEIYKDCYLSYILVKLSGNSTIIFCDKCVTGQKLTFLLRNLGFDAIPLNGKMSQDIRLGALNKFKSGEKNILVATDVASRGLHIPDVDLVINYDVPITPKDYIHRVGRTARIGKSGRALTLVTQYDIEQFQKIEQYIGIKMELYRTEESSVMLLLERVSESQRFASNQMKKIKSKFANNHRRQYRQES